MQIAHFTVSLYYQMCRILTIYLQVVDERTAQYD